MKKNYVLLRKELDREEKLLKPLMDKGAVIVCRHASSGKIKKISFRALHDNDSRFWEKSGKPWSYYIDFAVLEEARGLLASQNDPVKEESHPSESLLAMEADHQSKESSDVNVAEEDPSPEGNYGARFSLFRNLSLKEREAMLERDKKRLDELASKKKISEEEKLKTLMDVTADSAMANKVTVDEAFALDNADAQLLSTKLIMQTDDIVEAVTGLLSQDLVSNKLFATLMDKSDGSTVRHMTRVFLKSLSFLIHYNDQINNFSLAHKIRSRFDQQYRRYYMRLLPGRHASEVTLKTAFEGGLQAVPGEDLHQMATGFLLHDIGKQENIEYYEGDEAYHRETIIRHVLLGEEMIQQKTGYSDTAAYVAGFHHEYYNDPAGYGSYRGRLALMKKRNSSFQVSHAVSFDPRAVRECRALAFFPAKMLEVVDVYDALTDPDRKYKEPMSPEEALKMMRMEFVQRQIKLDPLLFDIFIGYLKASGEIED